VALAQPDLHGFAQMENATNAIIATLRTMIAMATTSMLESYHAPSLAAVAAAAIWIMCGDPSHP